MRFGAKSIKRLIDISVSSMALILLSPLYLMISLVVWISSGSPIIFRQARLGQFGRSFQIIKFRTMFVGAPDLRNPDGSAFSASDDPRLTSVGGFLRRASLDEIPQLFNVFKGEMSLVGPRPDQVDQLAFYTEEEKLKLSVRPGITGLAQISGRNKIPWDQRKKLDVEYVQNWSLSLDFKILFQTIPYVLRRKDIHISAVETGESQ